MFEDTNFDFDDDDDAAILRTSFTPVVSSTQTCSPLKRHSQEIDKENLKKLKLSNDEQSSFSSHSVASPKKSETIQVSVDTPNRIVKRRFPGPAGLLPERTESNKSILDIISDERYKNDDTREMMLCSQQTVSVFEDGPWKEMTKDFYVPNGECLYEKFNIGWIKKQASLRKMLVNHKAPFLAAVIQSLEILDGRIPTVNVTLKDGTGDIQGTVLHSLYEEYSDCFTTGSVLVLKQFGVLSAGYNNHCLTITPNNLMTIYCLEIPKRPPNDDDTQVACVDDRNVVKKVVIQTCTVDDIMKKYNEDVAANEEKERCINFGKIYQNHGNLLRSGSDGDNRHAFSCNRLQENNNQHDRNDFVVPKSKNIFNRSSSENSAEVHLPLEVLSRVISVDETAKKKFNFKSRFLQTSLVDSSTKSKDLNTLNDSQKVSSENANCDIIVSSSQNRISVKPDNKEHSEIWKNLLEDVDADSLFDEF